MASVSATYVWKPSSARRVVLDTFVPVPRGSTALAPPPLNWASKDPSDVLDYELDISPALIGNESDAIASVNIEVFPNAAGDLTLNSTAIDGPRIIMWLAAGQPGTVYTVTVSVTTNGGRTLQRSVLLPVLALSSSGTPATAITTDSGTALTDSNGNPVLSA